MHTSVPSIATMANITGNITLTTNRFLEIEQIIRSARERAEGEDGTESSWTGTIKFMLWNATGLMPNLDRVVRRMLQDEIHITFCVETWLHPERAIPRICRDTSAVCTIHPVGYERGKNGISMLINPNHIKHPAVKSVQVLDRDTLNGTYLLVQLGNIKILCVYYPPSGPTEINTWLDEILIKCRINITENFILLGDFNARLIEWRDHSSNTRGPVLKDWTENRGLIRIDSGPLPTYVTSRGNSIIDHIFSNIDNISGETSPPMVNIAGHRPIIGRFESTTSPKPIFPTYMRLKLEKLRIKDIRDLLASRLNSTISFFKSRIEQFWNSGAAEGLDPVASQVIIDEFDRYLTECILRPSKEVLGEKKCGKMKVSHEFLDSPTLKIIAAAIETEESEENVKELIKKEQKELQRLRKDKFDEFANEVSAMPASDLMKITSSMLTNRKKQMIALNSTDEALERYRSHFKTMNCNSLPSAPQTIEPIVLNSVDYPIVDQMEPYIRTTVLADILKWISWNKSPGATGLTYDVLKISHLPVLEAIQKFFNLILKLKRIPASWKRALIIPVPKKGDLCDIKNYRPISLTEPLRKLFEHCMLRMVNDNVGECFLTQGGFRTNHCCNDMIVVLHEAMKTHKGLLHVAFLDIRAAYDSVDRRILWRRCRNRGLSSEAVDILSSLFDHNSGQVVVGGRRSEPFHIEAGVLQGSVLSPCLYSLFIDDLAKTLSLHQKVKVGEVSINCTMYADDIALFSTDPAVLQDLLNVCAEHAKLNRYRFNASKCEVISDNEHVFKIDGDTLPHTLSFKYLGMEMNRKGIDEKAFIERRCVETKRAAEKLSGMGMNIGGFSVAASSLLYKVFIRPKLESSMCILLPLKRTATILDRTQNQILRRIIRAGRTASGVITRSLLQAPSMTQRIKWLRSRYIRRFDNILESNHILKQASTKPRSWLSRLRKGCYPEEYDKMTAWSEEMDLTNRTTNTSTLGFLEIETSRKVPWFLRSKVSTQVSRPILNWILKRYPGRDPPICSNCLLNRATQTHIAECNRILQDQAPNVPARFRPEYLLTSNNQVHNADQLLMLALEIAKAVQTSLPDLDFSILSSP